MAAVSVSSAPAFGQATQAVFAADQAQAGEAVYQESCAGCHLPTLRGAFEAPELAGPNFRSAWGGRPAADLLGYITQTMPPSTPGSLSAEQYAAVTAYLISENGVAPGNGRLTASSSGQTVAAAGGGVAASAAVIPPVPGRLGTGPSPDALDRPPPPAGEFTETATSVTRTLVPVQDFDPATDAVLRSPPAEDWLHWRGNPQAWGYSALDQINRDNVGQLQLAWAWGMEEGRSQQAPLVRDGIMFVSNPGNVVQALDASNGTLLWEYRRKWEEGEGRGQLRTLAIWEDMIYVATEDAHMVALDARTGVVRWETEVADAELGFGNSSGPIVADGKVIDGIDGCTRFTKESCFITAHDARTGEELWRTYTVARPGEPGGDTWGNLPLELRGGGDVWYSGSYDPELGLVYYGTAQAKPWVAASRGLTTADSTLYANATLALDIDDGRIVWYRVHVPGETLDMDEAYERILVDVDGRPVALSAGKTGILWKLDRRDGTFLGLKEMVYQDILEIDEKTGAVKYREDIAKAKVGDYMSVCPSTSGGKNWPAGAYHPETNLLIMPLAQACMDMVGREMRLEEGSGGSGAVRYWKPMPGKEGKFGKLGAYDVRTMEEVWSFEQESSYLTATLTTGGGLVFAGDHSRHVRAHDVRTGEVLWETRLATPVMGFPISYEVDGVQYVAFATGQGGGSPWRVPTFLNPEEVSAEGHNTMYVFRVPER